MQVAAGRLQTVAGKRCLNVPRPFLESRTTPAVLRADVAQAVEVWTTQRPRVHTARK